jgi:hypothetical protein
VTSFDELIGAEPAGSERERLRSVHELLLAAGPPPELSPELDAGPTLAMTLGRARRISHGRGRGRYLLVAAAALVALVIGIGVSLPRHGHGYALQSLRGTSFAPSAVATLDILSSKGEKPQLKLDVKGLPAAKEAYVVYLVRNGRPVAPCGSFIVSNANQELTKQLVSPYPLKHADTWIVTTAGHGGTPGVTVLKTVT